MCEKCEQTTPVLQGRALGVMIALASGGSCGTVRFYEDRYPPRIFYAGADPLCLRQ